MLNTLKRIFSDGKLMGKLLFTLLVLMVFRLGTFIPVPLIDTTVISTLFEGNDFLTILNVFSGGGLSNFSILALGISPYITASIVTQMLQMLVPSFQEMAEQGEVGKQKLNRITRYLAIVLAFIQALVLLFGLGVRPENILTIEALYHRHLYWLFYIYMALVITAGSAFVMWLADMITRYGIGNGSSMIISAGIVTSVPAMFGALHNMYIVPGVSFRNVSMFALIVFLYVLMILFVVFMEAAKRKIPVQYANRQAGPKATSDIPVKINSAGVIPVIFAATLMSIPLTIVGVMGLNTATSNSAFWLDQIFNNQNIIGMVLYILLIFFFSFFYAFLMVDPDKIADNLSKQGAFVPGYRPGEDTRKEISRILFRTTLIGATYLSFVAMVPILVTRFFGFTGSDAMAISIGGTSILILVGVAVETVKQLETNSQTNDYKGFID